MSNTELRREQARSRRRALLITAAALVVLAFLGIVFKNYWDARVRAAHTQSGPVYTPKAKAQAQVALFIGDSMVSGSGASSTQARFSTIVANTYRWFELNESTGGSGYHSGNPTLVDQVTSLKRFKPAVIVVSAGRNDGYSPDVQANVFTFFEKLREEFPKAKIFVVEPLTTNLPPTRATGPQPIDQLRNSVRSAAYSVGATYLSIGDTLLAKPQLLAANEYDANDAGHRAIADAIIAALKSNGINPK